MKVFGLLCCTLIVLQGCQQGSWTRGSVEFETPTGPSNVVFGNTQPRQPTYPDVTALRDMFTFHKAVALELTDGSILGDVTDVVFHDDHWFVVDDVGKQVLAFHKDGTYSHPMGRYGKGPGEYKYPIGVKVVYGGNIAVSDLNQGNILVYTPGGEHLRTLSRKDFKQTVIPTIEFAWPNENQLYLINFNTATPHAPAHLLVDASGDPPYTGTGFGERYLPIEKARLKGSGSRGWTAFKLIGDFLWLGSPYDSRVEIFDRAGHPHGIVDEAVARNPEWYLSLEDFKDVDKASNPKKAMKTLTNSKWANRRIIQVGGLVILSRFRLCDVFTTYGQLVATNLTITRMVMHVGYDNFLVAKSPQGMSLDRFKPTAERDALLAEGYNEDANPFLMIYELKPEFAPKPDVGETGQP